MLVADFTSKVPTFRCHIASDDDVELKYWTKHLGVSRDELQSAIKKVGNSAAAVRKELETLRASNYRK